MVTAGFEPTTPWLSTRRSTGLSYVTEKRSAEDSNLTACGGSPFSKRARAPAPHCAPGGVAHQGGFEPHADDLESSCLPSACLLMLTMRSAGLEPAPRRTGPSDLRVYQFHHEREEECPGRDSNPHPEGPASEAGASTKFHHLGKMKRGEGWTSAVGLIEQLRGSFPSEILTPPGPRARFTDPTGALPAPPTQYDFPSKPLKSGTGGNRTH